MLIKYYLKIKVFIKQDANILSNYRPENYKIKLLKDKQVFFVQNYKSLSKQKTNIMKKLIYKHLGKFLLGLVYQQQQYQYY